MCPHAGINGKFQRNILVFFLDVSLVNDQVRDSSREITPSLLVSTCSKDAMGATALSQVKNWETLKRYGLFRAV